MFDLDCHSKFLNIVKSIRIQNDRPIENYRLKTYSNTFRIFTQSKNKRKHK